ncbi:MAG: 1,4-dihydroxy-6-naphthoate synthase [Bacteroidetes bacterium 47-18]|nr:MAG: 1,4-dihydroxy-6-naphthoate synthase [Bacteroidetes bacterium 47-18]
MRTYTIAFSPCPNDTFIFDAMVHRKIDTGDLGFEYILEDVETLNHWAMDGRYDISKISYSVLSQLLDSYRLLRSGSALGRGVGPLLLTREPLPAGTDIAAFLQQARIAIPGEWTTANFLLNSAFPAAQHKEVVLFSDIEQALLDGKYDAGLVIHESRFTYAERGLHCLMDMGQWWEAGTGMPIPLGGIVLKKEIPAEDARQIEALIRKSVQYAWEQYPALGGFVTRNAQEMSEEVMRKHIELYVNAYSLDLGPEGCAVVKDMIDKAKQAGLCKADAVLEWAAD